MTKARLLCPVAAALLVLAGCGSDRKAGDDAPASSQPRVTTTATTTPEPFSGGRATVAAGTNATDIVLLERIDVGRHEGFDRVVFRFRGPNVPGYRVGFVRRPLLEDGSGNTVPITGDAIIGVRLEPASGFDLEASKRSYDGPRRIDGSRYGTSVVTELARTGDFEGVLNWAIALRGAADFRVLRLGSPARLVVDVAN